MYSRAEKTKENKTQPVANAVSQRRWTGESTFQFADNRPEAVVQRKLQEMANNSLQTKKPAPMLLTPTIQRQIDLNNLMGFIYACEGVGLNVVDRGSDIFVWADGGNLEERHIHIFFTFNDEPPHQISTILPKDFLKERPNLANISTGDWAANVGHMHAVTKNSVTLLKKVIDKDGVGY